MSTHDITILAFLSTHAPLIYKQDPTLNLSNDPTYYKKNKQFSTNAKFG
jgi:hypothetical protein